MLKSRVLTIGSLNMDLVVRVDRHPAPGETVLGGAYQTFAGGKGGNQAVAAAKAGGDVQFVGCVGSDEFGQQLRAGLQSVGVDVSAVAQVDGPSGIALIVVDRQGQNRIVVSPGANFQMLPDRLDESAIVAANLLLLQLEIPLETVETVISLAFKAQTPILLNPAPAQLLPPALLQQVAYLVVNESEAALLTQQSLDAIRDRYSAEAVARQLSELGAARVVVTLGSQGVVWFDGRTAGWMPALAVEVVDTTGAGDAFCGALAVRLGEGAKLPEAIAFANAAGAVAVSTMGAQASLGDRAAIEAMLDKNPR
ncbi:MAG: ribokinase [Synechococcus sp.]